MNSLAQILYSLYMFSYTITSMVWKENQYNLKWFVKENNQKKFQNVLGRNHDKNVIIGYPFSL